MPPKNELFSIQDSKTKSLGAHVEFGRLPSDPNAPVTVPEIAALKREEGLELIGAFIWQTRTLGELWESQIETYQFILDNIDKI